MKRREWSLVIALLLINYVVFNTFFNLAYQSRQPKPTPSRTPYPTFTPNWDATATRVAELPPTATPKPVTPTSPSTPVPSSTATTFAPTASATATRRATRIKATATASKSRTITHTLQSGETLYQVAVQYRVNVADLLKANDLKTPNDVNTGTVLTVPLAVRTNATATRSPTRRARPTSTAAVKTHTVQSGETLSLIAKEYGITTTAIIEANDLENPNVLSVGQVLTIPVNDE